MTIINHFPRTNYIAIGGITLSLFVGITMPFINVSPQNLSAQQGSQ